MADISFLTYVLTICNTIETCNNNRTDLNINNFIDIYVDSKEGFAYIVLSSRGNTNLEILQGICQQMRLDIPVYVGEVRGYIIVSLNSDKGFTKFKTRGKHAVGDTYGIFLLLYEIVNLMTAENFYNYDYCLVNTANQKIILSSDVCALDNADKDKAIDVVTKAIRYASRFPIYAPAKNFSISIRSEKGTSSIAIYVPVLRK